MKPLLALIVLVGVVAGCRPVASWQRGTLAHPCMTDTRRGDERRARLHMLGARESSQGAAGDTGGGCGCN